MLPKPFAANYFTECSSWYTQEKHVPATRAGSADALCEPMNVRFKTSSLTPKSLFPEGSRMFIPHSKNRKHKSIQQDYQTEHENTYATLCSDYDTHLQRFKRCAPAPMCDQSRIEAPRRPLVSRSRQDHHQITLKNAMSLRCSGPIDAATKNPPETSKLARKAQEKRRRRANGTESKGSDEENLLLRREIDQNARVLLRH